MYTCVFIRAAQRHGHSRRKPNAWQLTAGSTRYRLASPRGAALASCHLTHPLPPRARGPHARSQRGETVTKERPCCFSRYARVAARTAFAVLNNIYCIPAYVVWMMALRLVRPVFAPLYWKVEGMLYHWLLAMVSLWAWTAGYERNGAQPSMEQCNDTVSRDRSLGTAAPRQPVLTLCGCVVVPEDGR
ncbi:Acyl-CoA:lysophosphatidylglycerol acyltransferase 1 [Papilio xuthus]|uniref:Acyl-CoA:lysophosphatidylglycerol acyltransferase 1 n=1 Tax=Papilio xuthus TaxID=66420 RepID=A0A194QGJ5_PAPXU|nr:Acyl-CoA:lysophosphatidylglycerol acyltransferase 1 [Papilio xuthus]